MWVLNNRNNIADVHQQYEAMSIHVVCLHVCKLCQQMLYDQPKMSSVFLSPTITYVHTHTHTPPHTHTHTCTCTHTHTHTTEICTHFCTRTSVCTSFCVCVCSPRSVPCLSHSLITLVTHTHTYTQPYSLTLFWLHIFHLWYSGSR